MKGVFIGLMALGILIFLAACAGEGPQEAARMPSWAEELGLEEDAEVMAHISRDFPYFTSIEGLRERATDIVRVEFLDQRVELINTIIPPDNALADAGGEPREEYEIYTVYRILVLEVFQGGAEIGDTLEVKQVGGQWNHIHLISYDYIPFSIGDDMVLFLETYDIEGMPGVFLNPGQSAYHFGPAQEAGDLYTPLESLIPENRLTLTLGDLTQMKADYFNDFH